ncbi:Hypothetical protein GLP15_3960 [Giardia lamblia P15]|uniref:Uncharacterized protein n=1 Tax=Giardia intestinalis (strain P15) TaxID=658858 RepID=E1F9G8_GIAIA|nr:Hypothetical protein GLP15_3960 [Giardia lamblia P15]
MAKDPFLARMRAEGILNSATEEELIQWWAAENVSLFQNTLSQYVEAETKEKRLALLDEVCAVILAVLHSLSKELPATTMTTGLLSCSLETMRCIFNNGDLVHLTTSTFVSSLLLYLTTNGVIISLYGSMGAQFIGNILSVAAGLAKCAPEKFVDNYLECFQSIVLLLFSSVPDEERVALLAFLIQASIARLSPFYILGGRPNAEYYEFLVRILSSAYAYPDQLLLAINEHITDGCATIETALARIDKEEEMLLHDPSDSKDITKTPCFDPFLFLMLDAGVSYFFHAQSDDSRAITLNIIRSYTQHFLTSWIPFLLDLELRDAEVGMLFCSVFLERYRQMHYSFSSSNDSIDESINIEKNFFAIRQVRSRLSINQKTFLIFNSNYPHMYDPQIQVQDNQQPDAHTDETGALKKSHKARSRDASQQPTNTAIVEQHIDRFYNPKPISIILPCSMTDMPSLGILGSVLYSAILIGLTSHASELRRRALDAAENLLWSVNYTFASCQSSKSGKLPSMKAYAGEINSIMIPLVKDRFLDSCEYIREAAISIFANYYRVLLEYLDYTTTLDTKTISEEDNMFVVLLERLDKLVEPHVYVRPLKIQMPPIESDLAITANEELISLSLAERLNDRSTRVRSAATIALQSLYMAGYHRLATPLIHYTHKFGLEGELELFKCFHTNTHLSIYSVIHRILTFFDGVDTMDFFVFIRVLARQKLLKKIVENTFSILATRRHSATFIKKQWDESIAGIYGGDQDAGTQTYFNSFYDYMVESARAKSLADFMNEGEALLDTIYDKTTKKSTGSDRALHLSKIEDAAEYITVAQRIKNKWLFLHIFSFPFCHERFLHKIVKLTSVSYFYSYLEKQKDTEVFQTSPLTCALLLRSILIVNPQLFVHWKHLSVRFFFNVFEETKASGAFSSVSPTLDQHGAMDSSSSQKEKGWKSRGTAASKFIEFSESLGLGIVSSKTSDHKPTSLSNLPLYQSDLATPSSEPDTTLVSIETTPPNSKKAFDSTLDITQHSQDVGNRTDQVSLAIIGIHVAILLGGYVYISESQLVSLFSIDNELKEICGATLVDLASTAFNLASVDKYACLVTRNMLFKHVTCCPWTILALYSSFHEWDVVPSCNINYRHAIYYNLLRRLCSTCTVVPDELWGKSWSTLMTSTVHSNSTITEDAKSRADINLKVDITQNPLLIKIYNTLIEEANNNYQKFNKRSPQSIDIGSVMEKAQSLMAVFPEFVKHAEDDHISSLSECLFTDIDAGTELLIQTPYLKRFPRETDRIIAILPVLAYGSHLYALSKDSARTSKLISYYNVLIETILFPFTIKVDDTQNPVKMVQQVSPIIIYDILPVSTRATVMPAFKLLEAVHTLLLFQLCTDQRTLQLQTSYSLFMMITAAHYGLVFAYSLEEGQSESRKTITATTLFGSKTMQKAILHGISSTTLRTLLTCVEFGNMPCRLIGILIAGFTAYIVGYCEIDFTFVFNNDEEATLPNSVNDESGVIISISKYYLLQRNMKSNIPDVPGKGLTASMMSSSAILADMLPSPIAVKQSLTQESIDFMHKFVTKLINISLQAMEQFPISFMLRQEVGSNAQIALLSGRPEYSIFILIYVVHNYVFQIACSMANQHRITVLHAAKYLVSRKTGITLFIDTAILILLEILMHSATNVVQSIEECSGSLSAGALSGISAPQFTISILQLCIAKALRYSTKTAGGATSVSEEARSFLYKTVLSIFAHRIKTFTDYERTLPLDVLLQIPSALFTKASVDFAASSGETVSRSTRDAVRQSILGATPVYVKERTVMFAQNSELLDSLAKISLTPKNRVASPYSSSSLRETPKRRAKA